MVHAVILVVHVMVAIGLIALVLLQQGKGADAGAAFGSGASATVFGARGSASFLSRTTAVLATVFFVTSLSLAYLTTQKAPPASVMEAPAAASRAPAKATPNSVPQAPSPTKDTGAGGEVPRVD